MFDLFNSHSATVVRHAPGTFDDNSNYVSGAITNFNVTGDLQPLYRGNALASNEQKLLPEGATSEDARRFYCTRELKTVDQFDKTVADVLTFNHMPAKQWYVWKAGDWNSGLEVDHGCYIIVRLDFDAQR